MMADTSQRVPVGGVLTPRMERMIRLGSIGSAVVIAISAMVLSYAGLLDLALDAQIHPRLALLVPIMVDGLQFVGSLGVVYSTLSGLRSWYPWLLMLMGVSVSAWGNWQAAPEQMTAKLLHAAAPVILALVLEELLRVMRHKVQMHAEREQVEAEAAVQAAEQAEATAEQAQAAPLIEHPVESPSGSTAEPVAPASLISVDEPVADSGPRMVPTAHSGEADTAEPVLVEHAVEPGPESKFSPTPAEIKPAVVAPAAVPVMAASVAEPAVTEPAITEPAAAAPVATVPVVEAPIATQPAVTEAVSATRTSPASAPAQAEPRATVTETSTSVAESDEETLPPYPEDGTFKDQIRAILLADPDIPAAKIARLMKKDGSHTRKTVRIVRAELDEEAAIEAAASVQRPTPPAPATPAAPVANGSATRGPVVAPLQQPVGDRSTADLTGADPFAVAAPVGAGR